MIKLYERIIEIEKKLYRISQTEKSILFLRDYSFFLIALMDTGIISNNEILEKAMMNLKKINSNINVISNNISLWYGLSGIGMLTRELNKFGLAVNLHKQIVERVEQLSRDYYLSNSNYLNKIRNHRWFDLFYGITGTTKFLYESGKTETADKLVLLLSDFVLESKFLHKLDSPFLEYSDCYDFDKFNRAHEKMINLDISHGLASVLYILKESKKKNLSVHSQSINNAIEKLEMVYFSKFNYENTYFIKEIFENSKIDTDRLKLTWSRGDIPILICLLKNKDRNARDWLNKELLIDNLMKELDTENIAKTLNFCYGSSGIYFQLKILNEYYRRVYNQMCIPEFILEEIQQKVLLNLDMNYFFKENDVSALNIVDGLLSILVPVLFSKKKGIDFRETFVAKMFLID